MRLLLLASPFFLFCILLGQQLISILYDSRYEQAGIYFVIFSTATAIRMLRVFFAETMFVKDDSYGHAFVMFFSSGLHILGVVIGFVYGGVIGMLWGGVVAELLIYPLAVFRVYRHRVWVPGVDLLMIVLYTGLCAYITNDYLVNLTANSGGAS